MSKKLSFFGSAFYYTIGVVAAQGTTFLALMILARLMSPEDYGLLSLYGTWASVFGTIVGIQAHGSLNNARIDYGKENLDKYTSASFGLGALSMLVVLGVLLIFQNPLSSIMRFPAWVLVLCLFQGFFSYCIQHIAQKYRVQNRPGPFIGWTASVAVLRLVLSVGIVLAYRNSGANDLYYGDIYGSFFAYAAVGVAAIVVIIAKGKVLFNAKWWKYCFLISMPFVLSGLANLVLGQSDRYMLIALLGDSAGEYATGIYSYVYNIGMIATAVWLAFNNAWSVWYYDKTHAGEKEQIVTLYKKYSLFVTLLSMAFILIAPDVIRILGGAEYAEGVYIIPLITAGCYFQFLYTFPVAYESYKRKTGYIAIGTLLAAVVNILVNLYTIPKFGAMGAAISSACAFVALFVFHFIIARFIIKNFELSFWQLLKPALYVVAGVAVTYLAIDIWPLRIAIMAVLLVFSFRVFKQSRHIMME